LHSQQENKLKFDKVYVNIEFFMHSISEYKVYSFYLMLSGLARKYEISAMSLEAE
jgi:hypothetical protein